MIVVYYKDRSEGKIKNHQILSADWTEEKVKEKIEEYNANPNNGAVAIMEKVEEGSFEAYLLHSLSQKLRIPQDTIDEALSALYDAIDAVKNLEGKSE